MPVGHLEADTAIASAVDSQQCRRQELHHVEKSSEEEMPRPTKRRKCTTVGKELPGVMRGLQPKNIIDIDQYLPSAKLRADTPPISTMSKNRRYATRELTNGPSIALYDSKYHPMDDTMHKGRAKAHRQRSAFARRDYELDEVSIKVKDDDDDDDDDDSSSQMISLGSENEDSSPSRQEQEKKSVRRKKERPLRQGSRTSTRNQQREGPKPVYNIKWHPIDDLLNSIDKQQTDHDDTSPATRSCVGSATKHKSTGSRDSKDPTPTTSRSSGSLINTRPTKRAASSTVPVNISSDRTSEDDSDDETDNNIDEQVDIAQQLLEDSIGDEKIEARRAQKRPDRERERKKHIRPKGGYEENRNEDDVYLDNFKSSSFHEAAAETIQQPEIGFTAVNKQPMAIMQLVGTQTAAFPHATAKSAGSLVILQGHPRFASVSSVSVYEDARDAPKHPNTVSELQRRSHEARIRDAFDKPKENQSPDDSPRTMNPRVLTRDPEALTPESTLRLW